MIEQSCVTIVAIGLITTAAACGGRVRSDSVSGPPVAAGNADVPASSSGTPGEGGAGQPVPDAGIDDTQKWDGGEGGVLPPQPQSTIDGGSAPPVAVGCNDLVADGPAVLSVFEAGPPPNLGQGGTIVDGVYDLVQDTIYESAPTSAQYFDSETIRISEGGTRLDYVSASTGSRITESLAPAGASLNPTTICPGPGLSVGPYYTATPGQFVVVNGLYVSVFAMRP
jgi:hypothetical protein